MFALSLQPGIYVICAIDHIPVLLSVIDDVTSRWGNHAAKVYLESCIVPDWRCDSIVCIGWDGSVREASQKWLVIHHRKPAMFGEERVPLSAL